MIYKILSNDIKYSTELHNKQKKHFCFSNLLCNKYDIQNNNIIFLDNEIKLNISSTDNYFIKKIYDGMISSENIQISKLKLKLKSVVVEPQLILDNNTIFTLNSPIIINQKTILDKYEQYLSPENNQYEELFFKNIKSKMNITNDNKYKIHILSKPKSKLIDIKGIKNKGWLFDFKIDATLDILNTIYYNGVGCKNSQGFGFVKIK